VPNPTVHLDSGTNESTHDDAHRKDDSWRARKAIFIASIDKQ
jgi:hypothetical protein